MVWSITGSGVQVNVDIIFQENSTIGDRIKLSENIVKALIQMKCPARIEPNQIQGLDYPMLFPVLQWLVRKVIETRHLTGDLVRQLSVSQFSKFYKFEDEEKPPSTQQLISNVMEAYKPKRLFKQKKNVKFDSLAARTDATLLEYGEKIFLAEYDADDDEMGGKRRRSGMGAAAKEKEAARKAKEEEERKAAAANEQNRLANMQKDLSAVGDSGNLIKGDTIGSIVNMGSEQIRLAAEEYEADMRRLQGEEVGAGGGVGGFKGQEQTHIRQVEALQRQIAAQEAKLEEGKGSWEAILEKVAALRATVEEKEAYIERIITETNKIDEMENAHENQDVLKKLKGLVLMNETLKKQEADFKSTCKEQMGELQALVERLNSGDGDDEESKRMREIEAIYEADLDKLQKMRKVMAKKNQEIANIRRQIDEIPTRAELLQYERRCVLLFVPSLLFVLPFCRLFLLLFCLLLSDSNFTFVCYCFVLFLLCSSLT